MRTLIALAFVLFSTFGIGQTGNLVAEGVAPNIYLSHTVQPKENYYSIARAYNTTPAAIATLNKTLLSNGLKIGQVIKVPLTEQNFDQQGAPEAGEALLPVYHVVSKSETLFRIGNNFNKVPLAQIRDWNSMTGDKVSAGSQLIVGYLKVKNEQLGNFSAAGVSTTPANTTSEPMTAKTETAVQQPATTTNVPQQEKPAPTATNTFKPEVDQPVTEQPQTATAKPETTQPVTEEKPGVLSAPPAKPASSGSAGYGGKQPDMLTPRPEAVGDEGFFAGTFAADADKKEASSSGDAATFKSTSGWQDKKYYALMNNVLPGTIVKVTSGDKIIYAKVLGAMPEMKENANLLVRLSTAAASYLGKAEPKFPVQVSYYQ